MSTHYDIDAMRAAGHDPSSIAAAVAYNARWDALLASDIGPYLRDGTPDDVELASGVRLLPLAVIVEGTRELAPDKILFDEGLAPIASSIGGHCLAYDPADSAFYWADCGCVFGTEFLLTPGDYHELPYSAENLRKALVLISSDPPQKFLADLRAGAYEARLNDLD